MATLPQFELPVDIDPITDESCPPVPAVVDKCNYDQAACQLYNDFNELVTGDGGFTGVNITVADAIFTRVTKLEDTRVTDTGDIRVIRAC